MIGTTTQYQTTMGQLRERLYSPDLEPTIHDDNPVMVVETSRPGEWEVTWIVRPYIVAIKLPYRFPDAV